MKFMRIKKMRHNYCNLSICCNHAHSNNDNNNNNNNNIYFLKSLCGACGVVYMCIVTFKKCYFGVFG